MCIGTIQDDTPQEPLRLDYVNGESLPYSKFRWEYCTRFRFQRKEIFSI